MSATVRTLRGLTVLTVLAALAQPAAAQSAQNVLVVANAQDTSSVEVAAYYAEKRHVPADQVLKLPMPAAEEIPRTTYEAQIDRPIADWLVAHSAEDRILYIVLAKGVPIRISGTSGTQGTVSSVDSELTLLYRKLCQVAVPLAGSIKNPYFLDAAPMTSAKRFTHREHDIYLVTRLDGYTVADVKALIDRGAAPSKNGRILLDGRIEMKTSPGTTWLKRAAGELEALPGWRDRVLLDSSLKVLHNEPDVLGYYSWGSNDPANFARHLSLAYVPGAIGALFVSTDARTFEEPPADWSTSGGEFKGSRQSLIGDLIRDGITGVAGHVAEPYLNATIRPDILFPAYVSGMNLAEAFYLAMPFISWQTVVIGDPLCAPFRQDSIDPTDLDPGLDAMTGLSRYLALHRVAVVTTSTHVKPEAAYLFVAAQARSARHDRGAARQALEKATALEPGFVLAQMALANIYQGDGRWDAAIERYRQALAAAPNQPMLMNDLAYLLALHKEDARTEALSLAQRAWAASNGNPMTADTLGWIHHLMGNDASAEPLFESAIKSAPKNAEIQLHAAFVFAATGKQPAAKDALTTALALQKALADREDVRDLRTRLGMTTKH